jgi:cytidylate kinase
MIITLDGLSGTGKSTLANIIAEKLNYMNINTGLFYRLVGYIALEKYGYGSKDKLEEMVDVLELDIKESYITIAEVNGTINYNGLLLSNRLYDNDVTLMGARISKDILIRELINVKIKEASIKTNVVVEGRDCALNIFTNADLKILVTAKESIRYKRVLESRVSETNSITHEDLEKVDLLNSKSTPDVLNQKIYDYVIDTSHCSIDECVNQILDEINKIKILRESV